MAGQGTFDREKLHLNLARLKKEGLNFEIDVDPDLAVDFKEGKDIKIRNVLKAAEIFSDVKKGLVAAESNLKKVFDTTDVYQVAEIIIKQGEIQLSAEHRTKVREQKRKKLISLIAKQAVDPKTHLPHPPQRIEAAMEEAKVRLDERKSAEEQVKDVLKKINVVLPIKLENVQIEIHIPAEYAVKSYSSVKSLAKILNETWNNDGSWTSVIEMPAGLQNNLFDKLNSMTHGNAETKIIKSE